MDADEIQYPSGFSLKDVVGWGTTGLVVLDRSSNTIIKTPIDKDNKPFILREQQIYERFTEKGGHKGILQYYGTFNSGIHLEYASNHHLRTVNSNGVSQEQKLDWAIQISEAIEFIHMAGVIHGDLTCANIFVDEHLNAKLADFAGSSIDGSALLVGVTASHESPGPLLSIQGDLFAFGCVLYELMTGHVPYEGKLEKEIHDLYKNGIFPDTNCLGAIGLVITRCWLGKYTGGGAIVKDLKGRSNSYSQHETAIDKEQPNNTSFLCI